MGSTTTGTIGKFLFGPTLNVFTVGVLFIYRLLYFLICSFVGAFNTKASGVVGS